MKIALLNLMPIKEVTERDFERVLTSSPLPVEICLMKLRSHISTHTSAEHMQRCYRFFDEMRGEHFDGFIITGAPVEHLDFEQVDYWPELCGIFDWARTSVPSTLYICWAAQAGLYYHYGVHKQPLPVKRFGIFRQEVLVSDNPLFRNFASHFNMPHSRHTEVARTDIMACPELTVLAASDECGVSMVEALGGREIFITGHMEYPACTLQDEYRRDQALGRTDVGIPQNYYPGDNPNESPIYSWQRESFELYHNWLNFLQGR